MRKRPDKGVSNDKNHKRLTNSNKKINSFIVSVLGGLIEGRASSHACGL